MAEPVRSEVEAAIEEFERAAGPEFYDCEVQILAAARAWLSTPTEPTDEIGVVLATIKQAGHQIGWFDPASKRFCYLDEKPHKRDGRRYSIPVYAIAGLSVAAGRVQIEDRTTWTGETRD